MDEIQPKSPTSVIMDQIPFDTALSFSYETAYECTQFKLPHQKYSLSNYFFRHFGTTCMSINKNDRHFNYLESLFHATIVHLDLKGITIGTDRIKIDSLYCCSSKTLETARAILNRQTGNDPGIQTGKNT